MGRVARLFEEMALSLLDARDKGFTVVFASGALNAWANREHI